MKAENKNKLSREQAEEIYKDLKTRLAAINGRKPNPVLSNALAAAEAADRRVGSEPKAAAHKAYKQTVRASAKGASIASSDIGTSRIDPVILSSIAQKISGMKTRPNRGHILAVTLILCCVAVKATLSVFDYIGVFEVPRAEAVMMAKSQLAAPQNGLAGYSKEEIKLLTQLDARRVELEERARKLESRERELSSLERDFTGKLTELRELTQRLSLERDKNEKKRSAQLEQLANVYGSMNPQEAAQLLQQLDVSIALSLVQRMPEKRIGQILALMNPERALTITKMLSAVKQ